MKTAIALMFVTLFIFTGCAHINVPKPNKVVVTLNTEPQGAKVYEQTSGYLGQTPIKLTYTLDDYDYTRGYMNGSKLTLVYPGACVEEYKPKLRISSDLRPDPGRRSTGGKQFRYHKLIVLRASGQAVVPRYGNQSGNQDITIHNEKDDLDKANSSLDLFFKLNALKPFLR